MRVLCINNVGRTILSDGKVMRFFFGFHAALSEQIESEVLHCTQYLLLSRFDSKQRVHFSRTALSIFFFIISAFLWFGYRQCDTWIKLFFFLCVIPYALHCTAYIRVHIRFIVRYATFARSTASMLGTHTRVQNINTYGWLGSIRPPQRTTANNIQT